MSQSIRGPLRNWSKDDWESATNWISKKDGTRFTADELKSEFLELLSQGKEVIPIGKCDNFDFKDGCKGHPEK